MVVIAVWFWPAWPRLIILASRQHLACIAPTSDACEIEVDRSGSALEALKPVPFIILIYNLDFGSPP
jgi:hypothetical protein